MFPSNRAARHCVAFPRRHRRDDLGRAQLAFRSPAECGISSHRRDVARREPARGVCSRGSTRRTCRSTSAFSRCSSCSSTSRRSDAAAVRRRSPVLLALAGSVRSSMPRCWLRCSSTASFRPSAASDGARPALISLCATVQAIVVTQHLGVGQPGEQHGTLPRPRRRHA